MEKQAKIDPLTVARYGTGGALLGGSAAAVLSLAHAIRLARKREKQLSADQSDENTIVIRLPKTDKVARVTCDGNLPVSIKSEDKPKSGTSIIAVKSYRAGFYPNQKMKKGSAEKQADWPTLVSSILAATGGSMLGYSIIDKAYRTSVQRQLKAEEEAARTELMDAMTSRPQKVAESKWLSSFNISLDKSAQLREKSTFGYLDGPMAVAALLTLLGSGGTAYITKKILDNKLKEQQEETYKPPKVQKIVFKSAASLEDGEEQASAADLEGVQGALFLTMDKMSGHEALRHDPEVVKYAEAAETSLDDLYKLAQEQPNMLVSLLSKNPELRKSLQAAYMKEHPFLKHFTGLLNVPGLSNLADKMTYKKVNNAMQPKTAGFVMPSFVGSVLAEKAIKDSITPAPKKPLSAQEEVSAEKMQEFLNNLQLSASDPNAAAYLEDKQDEIRALLAQMAARGDI